LFDGKVIRKRLFETPKENGEVVMGVQLTEFA
jgi:hypothetical protein